MAYSKTFCVKISALCLFTIAILWCIPNESFAQSGRKKHQDQRTGKWGFVNYSNDIIVNPVFDEVDDFITLEEYGPNQYIARVKLGNKYGYIDTEGNKITGVEYDNCTDFLTQGFALVMKSDKQGLINRLGKIVLPIDMMDYQYILFMKSYV